VERQGLLAAPEVRLVRRPAVLAPPPTTPLVAVPEAPPDGVLMIRGNLKSVESLDSNKAGLK
jgi:hypothetical protein